MMTGGDDGDLGSSPAGGAPAPCCLGDCSRLLTKALEWCPDAASARAIDLGGLVVAHAELLEEWDALGEEEDESATAAIAAAADAFTRGALPSAAASAAFPLYAKFVADAVFPFAYDGTGEDVIGYDMNGEPFDITNPWNDVEVDVGGVDLD